MTITSFPYWMKEYISIGLYRTLTAGFYTHISQQSNTPKISVSNIAGLLLPISHQNILRQPILFFKKED